MKCITGCHRRRNGNYATVRLNDGADWVGVERKKELDQGRSPGGPHIGRATGCESVLPTLTECVLPDRYDLNQPSASSLIP